MTHYRMKDRQPSAIITANSSELKIYEKGSVYLNDGDNFEIRFFNPLQEKIGAEIIFNGNNMSDAKLVLRPGEDVSLDRFLNDNKKMLFDTYQINGNNSAAVEAAAKNGLIQINFYKEKQVYYTRGFTTFDGTNANSRTYGSGLPHFGCTNISSDGMMFGSVTTNGLDDTFTTQAFYSDEIGVTGNDMGEIITTNLDIEPETLETGRVEMGEESEQDLQTVEVMFEMNSFLTLEYQLKPLSTKTKTVTEVRNYCGFCSYRLRNKKWIYCPKCGNKL